MQEHEEERKKTQDVEFGMIKTRRRALAVIGEQFSPDCGYRSQGAGVLSL